LGHSKHEWLSGFLVLPNRIPSHDTFRRVFARLDPDELHTCFTTWIQDVFRPPQDASLEQIAVDGKTARRRFPSGQRNKAIHLIHAWACHSRLVLGQWQTEAKSNEITAIPQRLRLLDLN